jgi:hypothetical protein
MGMQLFKIPAKILFSLLLLSTLWIGLVASNATAEDNPVISVLIDGKLQQYEQPPIIQKGYTLVPLRAIFEALGAEIKWNTTTRTATAVKENVEIIISIGKDIAYVNGQEQQLDVGAQMINGRTMVPLRFISQAFGAYVNWRPTTNTVSIKTVLISPETTKLKMPIQSITPVEIIPISAEKPKQEEVAALQAPLNPPQITKMFTVPLSALDRDWKSFDTKYFKIYYYEQEPDIIIQSQFYDEMYETLNVEFGHPLPEQIPVYFLNTADFELDKEIPSWSAAAWLPKSKSMIIKIDASIGNEQQLMNFRHELIHAITLSSIDSQLYNTPPWFLEAVAAYYEQAKPYYDLGRSGVLYKAFLVNKMIPFSDISEDSSLWKTDEVGLIYAEAQSFYGYLVQQFGETSANEIFYTSGNFNAVMQTTTNQTMSSLEENWKTYLALSYANAPTLTGRIYFMDGSWYQGEIKNGLQHGKGKNYKNGKLTYSGDYKEGKLDGQGIVFYPSGSIYSGQMKDDQPSGFGKYYWLEGDRFEGNMLNGLFDGQGSYYWSNGDTYVGEWKAGKQEGQGVIRNIDGSSYSGLFKAGKIN